MGFFSHPIRTSLLSRLVRAWSSKRLEGHHAYATQYRTQTKTTTRWTLDLIFPGDYEFKFSIFCLFQYQVYLFLFRYRQYVKHACICMYKYSECRLQESSNTHSECHWSNHRIRLLSRTFQNQPKQRPLGTRYSGNVWNSPTHGILYCLNHCRILFINTLDRCRPWKHVNTWSSLSFPSVFPPSVFAMSCFCLGISKFELSYSKSTRHHKSTNHQLSTNINLAFFKKWQKPVVLLRLWFLSFVPPRQRFHHPHSVAGSSVFDDHSLKWLIRKNKKKHFYNNMSDVDNEPQFYRRMIMYQKKYHETVQWLLPKILYHTYVFLQLKTTSPTCQTEKKPPVLPIRKPPWPRTVNLWLRIASTWRSGQKYWRFILKNY